MGKDHVEGVRETFQASQVGSDCQGRGCGGASWDLLHPELKGQVSVAWKWDERGREANASLPRPPS